MTKTEEALQRTRRRLELSKLVSLVCMVAVLIVVNTDRLPALIRYGLVAVLMITGLLGFIIGIRCVFSYPQLERSALHESAKVSPVDPCDRTEHRPGDA
jgi:hypothetical protein